MSDRHLPVRPDLQQLKHQAKDLLRAIRRGDPDAISELTAHHPSPPAPEHVKLADTQLALARSYQAPSWMRLVQCCQLIDAIWDDDVEAVRDLVTRNPALLHENAGIRNDNWGPPLSYAANVGRDRIITMLRKLGANDLGHAIDRAVLQGRIGTARLLHRMLGAVRPPAGVLGSPAYTLSVSGTEFLFEIGAEMVDQEGESYAPVDIVLESDSRNPAAKHRILELYAEHGFELPDTPMMALHRGRVDLLQRHLDRDTGLLRRTFSFSEIYPPSLRCQPVKSGGYDEMLPRTPVANATLLHVAVEFDEFEIAEWLLERGMNPDVPAQVDGTGIGGHTALFNAVVSYPNFWMNFTGGWAHSRKPAQARFAQLLLDHGANLNPRATFCEVVRAEQRIHREVTPLGWGDVFDNRLIVSQPAMQLIARRGGTR